jgi:hypothetical protein
MRRFLLHVLPGGFHRIRHYGLLANGSRRADLARVREALQVEMPPAASDTELGATTPSSPAPIFVCRHCGRTLLVVQTFLRGEGNQGAAAIMSRSAATDVLIPTSRAGTSVGAICATELPRPSTAHTAPTDTGIGAGRSSDVSATQPVTCLSQCSTGRLNNAQSP